MHKKASGVPGKIYCGIYCGLIGIALPVAEIIIGMTSTAISNIKVYLYRMFACYYG